MSLIRKRQKPNRSAAVGRSNRHFFAVVRIRKLRFPRSGRRNSPQHAIRAEHEAECQEGDRYFS
jgi:hypothetical protein